MYIQAFISFLWPQINVQMWKPKEQEPSCTLHSWFSIYDISWLGSSPSNAEGPCMIWLIIVGAWEKKLSKVVLFALKMISISLGAISVIFYYSLYAKTMWLQGLNFSSITLNVCVALNSQWEAAIAKYVGEMLIKIAPFDSNRAGCSIHSYFLAWVTKINVLII